MGKTTVADITELARHIEAEQKYLARLTARASANLVDGGLTAADKVRLHADIKQSGIDRGELCEKIRSMAAEAPERAAALLYHAATKLDTGNHEVGEMLAKAAAAMKDQQAPEGQPECYVTLAQMGAIISRRPRTMRRMYDDGKLPPPAVAGGNGKPHEWRWSDVRPILESESGKPLPEIFPADRFIHD